MANPQRRSFAKQQLRQMIVQRAPLQGGSASKKRAIEEKQASGPANQNGSGAKKQKADHKAGHSSFDFEYSSAGQLAAFAAEWMALLKKFTAGGVSNDFLLKGALPDEQRVPDLHRPEIDVGAGTDHKLEAALRGQVKKLRDRTDTALRQAFKQKGVDVGRLLLVVTKLLITQPGAEAQVAHIKVAKDEAECFSVMLHCNAAAESIRLPTSAVDLSLLRALTKEDEEHELTLVEAERAMEIKQEPDGHFTSRPASAGAALLFRADVTHFDPALAVDAGERVLLYALYAPSRSRQHDCEEIQPFADLTYRLDLLRQ